MAGAVCMGQTHGLGCVQLQRRRDTARWRHCLGLSWLWLCCWGCV